MTQLRQGSGGWLNFNAPPPHLTRSIALEESSVPGIMRSGVTVIAVLMALFLLWAAFAKVEEVASASGQIIPSGYIQTIQHLEGGIVREVFVHDGDLVEKDQPLIKMDDIEANADLGQMMARRNALALQGERLRRFVDGGSTDTSILTAEEQAILSSMVDARTGQQNILRDQISQKEKELAAIRSNLSAVEKNVVLMQEEYSLNKDYVERGSVSKMEVMRLERELNALQGQLGEMRNQEIQAQAAISEAQNRLLSLDSELRQNSMEKLGEIQAELAEVNENLSKLESAAQRTTINAPVRGIVKGMTIHTIGAVVEPGRVLMEIVPIEEELMVEALISPNDIGNIKQGQEVKIKVSAFDYARYGNVAGAIETISASTFQTEDGNSFYKARIKLEQNYVGANAGNNLILPGMTVQAEIITGQKTILDYLLKPLHTVTQSAFRER